MGSLFCPYFSINQTSLKKISKYFEWNITKRRIDKYVTNVLCGFRIFLQAQKTQIGITKIWRFFFVDTRLKSL